MNGNSHYEQVPIKISEMMKAWPDGWLNKADDNTYHADATSI